MCSGSRRQRATVQPGVHNKRFLFLVGLIDEHGSNLALRALRSRYTRYIVSSSANSDDARNVIKVTTTYEGSEIPRSMNYLIILYFTLRKLYLFSSQFVRD